jgi:glycosyltransferase involved in cell wall biosynthesis
MNILMILDNPFTHDPRVYNEAKSLVDNGHKVTVLAWDKTGRNPENEIIDDINVVRSYNTKLMDIIKHDFIFRNHRWWKKGFSDAIKLHKKKSFDIVHCHDLYTLPIGVKLKKKLGLPLIYDSHEYWEYSINYALPKPLSNFYIWEEKKGILHADHIITVAEPMVEHFQSIGCKNITIVNNCKKKISEYYIKPDNEQFTLNYIGGISKKRFVCQAIEVWKTGKNITFVVAGFGSEEEKVRKLVNSNDSKNRILFLGKIPMNKVISETLKSDAVLCMLDPSINNNRVGAPNKLFEAMVCGRPVIATKDTYSGKLVEKLDMGLAIDYNDKSFKNALIKLRENPKLCEKFGKNALEAAIREYNWKNQEQKLLSVYRGIKN